MPRNNQRAPIPREGIGGKKRRTKQKDADGIPVATTARMTSYPKTQRSLHASRTHASTETAPMLRWVFHRGTAALTCEIDAADRHHFDVCVVPHWDVASSLIEHFDDPISALERHADIARRLREAGWTSVDHVVTVGARGPRRTPTPLAA